MTTIRIGNAGRNAYQSRVLIPLGIPPLWHDSMVLHPPAWLSSQKSRHFGGIGCSTRKFTCIRTRSRTIFPDSCKAPTWDQESRQKSSQVAGRGLQKTRLPGIPAEIPTKRRDSAITVGKNPESRHFSML